MIEVLERHNYYSYCLWKSHALSTRLVAFRVKSAEWATPDEKDFNANNYFPAEDMVAAEVLYVLPELVSFLETASLVKKGPAERPFTGQLSWSHHRFYVHLLVKNRTIEAITNVVEKSR